MHQSPSPTLRLWPLFFICALMVGCANPKLRAPVEERAANTNRPLARPAAAASAPAVALPPPASIEPLVPVKPLPLGIENAGKPGFYTVKPGDNLLRISMEHGHPWRDVVRWNGLENPNVIEVGQVLRVVPPSIDAAATAARGVVAGRIEARPLEPRPGDAAAAAAASTGANPDAPVVTRDEDDVTWSWPSTGTLVGGFEEGKSKGMLIGGKAGDAVLAAADGRVVYAGSGLRGYGNLVIVKHNNTYLTAYAHNQTLLVKEDQPVRRGQKIAEMGSSDADRVQLHFEVRRQGKPVDPARLLPGR